MDDKLKRELSAAVERGAEDPAVKKLIGESAQARAYFNGLLAVDRALRRWPAPRSVSDKDSDSFVDAVLARLDEPVADSDFDPFAVPFADEREAQKTPRQHSEQHAMSQSNDQDNDDDLEGLAALMRPSRTGSSASVPPPAVSVRPGPALADDAMDESSGIVDIKHLAAIAKRASVPPASSDEAPKAKAEDKAEPAEAKAASDEKKADSKAEKKAEAKAEKSADKKSDEKKEAAADKKSEAKGDKKLQAVPAATAAPEATDKKGSNPVMWIGLVGIAAAAAFGVSQMNKGGSAASVNAEAPQSAAPSAGASAPSTNGAPQAQAAAPAQAPAPTTVAAPVAPAEGAVQPAVAPTQPAADPNAATTQQPPSGAAMGSAAAAAGASDQGATERRAPGNAESESTGAAPAARNAAARESSPEPAAPRPSTSTSTGASIGGSAGGSRGSSGASTASASSNTAAAAPTTTTTTRTTATAPTATAPTTGAAPAGGGAARPMSVDELMRRATGADRAEEAQRARVNEQAAAQASLPPQLTRSMVSGAMTPFNSQVRACAQGQTGTATAVLTVNGDGSVSNVVVSSPWGSGPNDCITNRLRTARFPAVQRPSSRVVYPFAVLAPQPGG